MARFSQSHKLNPCRLSYQLVGRLISREKNIYFDFWNEASLRSSNFNPRLTLAGKENNLFSIPYSLKTAERSVAKKREEQLRVKISWVQWNTPFVSCG